MNLKLLSVSAALLLSGGFTKADTLTIRGSGAGYSGRELRVFMQSDPLTQRQKPLLRIRADADDSFTFKIEVSGPSLIYIKSGIYCFSLLTGTKKEYEVFLPSYIAKSGPDEQNPFFTETVLTPEIINDKGDVNNLIRLFDSEYNPIFNQVAGRVFINYKRTEIPGLTESLQKFRDDLTDPFFTDYVHCRMLMLELVSTGNTTGRIRDASFINEKFIPHNPAYTDLVNQLFSGYLSGFLTRPDRTRFIDAVNSASFKQIKELVIADNQINNEQLTEYVILSGFYSLYNEGKLPADNIISAVSAMKKEASSGYMRWLSATVLDRILITRPGQAAPGFSLKDNNDKVISLKDLSGRYVLLNFTTATDRMAISEFEILKSWNGLYSRDLIIVTVLADKDFTTGIGKMIGSGYNWIFLNGSPADDIEYNYGIKMYPAFILLDRKGRIVSNPCHFPSENLEEIINKILVNEGSAVF